MDFVHFALSHSSEAYIIRTLQLIWPQSSLTCHSMLNVEEMNNQLKGRHAVMGKLLIIRTQSTHNEGNKVGWCSSFIPFSGKSDQSHLRPLILLLLFVSSGDGVLVAGDIDDHLPVSLTKHHWAYQNNIFYFAIYKLGKLNWLLNLRNEELNWLKETYLKRRILQN